MTSPIPGVTYPAPRTWAAGDEITVPRLRGDMTNLADLFAGGARPVLTAQDLSAPALSGTVSLSLYNSVRPLNSWNVTFGSSSPAYYHIPFAGYYLLQACATVTAGSASSNQYRYETGFDIEANSGGIGMVAGASVPGDGVNNDLAGGGACELVQFSTNAESGDLAGVYVNISNPNASSLNLGQTMFEWVGLPTSLNFPPPALTYGTVVSSPLPAAAFPSGQGTTLGSAIAAGGTVAVVNDYTGMVTGGALGLDYINSQLYQPAAEKVTITSVAGGTIGVSAAAFAHATGAPVAVPVSAAFLNQQCRDVIRFLSYPPLLRAAQTQAQSISTSGFPPTPGGNPSNQITNLSVAGGSNGIDTFSGFASNAWTVPVAGAYLVYGQIPYAGSTSAFSCSCGVSVNGGTILWGTVLRASTTGGAQVMTPAFRRLMRFAKNDAVTLWAYQGAGSSMNTVNNTVQFAKLITVFRAF